MRKRRLFGVQAAGPVRRAGHVCCPQGGGEPASVSAGPLADRRSIVRAAKSLPRAIRRGSIQRGSRIPGPGRRSPGKDRIYLDALAQSWDESAKAHRSLHQSDETLGACRNALASQRQAFVLAPDSWAVRARLDG